MKIAVIGGTGFLGKAIAREHDGKHDLLLAGSRDVEVRDRSSVHAFLQQHHPDCVILAAAVPDVDRCEREPDFADAVNHRGAANVAEACKLHNARLMFISTDYVFGGDESRTTPYEVDDAVDPVNSYGRTKVAGEQAVREILPGACIARVSWLFGAEGRCFPNALLDAIESGARQVSAVSDQHGAPNFTRAIARALLLMAERGAEGTLHVTNQLVTTWYDFSTELLPLAGLHDVELTPSTLAQQNRIAKRPHYSALSDRSLREFGIVTPDWRESLGPYLADRRAVEKQKRTA
ncbi:MAG: dTDP-4-dehydrorhamnose reductase [Acidobacteria bacterium]|nr:dTDP-4-dehydrorhamnose reductase [Acidobacteriota bacterium]